MISSKWLGTFFIFFAIVFFIGCRKDIVPTTEEYTSPAYPIDTLSSRYRALTIPADNQLTVDGVELGRRLFYDKHLSSTGTISCATCHKQEFAFGDNTPTSINVAGPTKRNTMPLFNSAMLKRYFWDGRTNTIKDAVADALQGEQHFDLTTNTTYFNTDTHYVNLFKRAFGTQNSISKDNVEKAITQFIISLISVKSEFETRPRTALTADQQAGFAIFMDASKGDCFHCHTDGPYFTFADQNKIFANNALQQTGTSYLFPDNGLGGFTLDQNDNGKFKIPVLRNLSYTAPYMHDGRFSTLEQVINFYSDSLKTSPTVDPLMEKFNNGGAHLTPTEKYQLLQFLKTLDDPAFITNPKFSAP